MLKNEFKYGEICSGRFNIYYSAEVHSILPELRQITQEIPGVDGVIDFGMDSYSVRLISVPLLYKGSFKQLRADRERIIAWLASNGTYKQLVLGREPGRYYLAKIVSQIDFENSSNRQIGTLEFMCNPPWQFLSDGTVLTPEQIEYVNCKTENGKFIKEFSGNFQSIRFYNNGTEMVKPIIKIIGNIKNTITLIYGEQKFMFEKRLGYDGIVIDCENETVKRMSDASNLYSFVNVNYCDFFELSPGECEIELHMNTATGTYEDTLTMILEFNPSVKG